jgi:hypothetical protein
MTETVIDRFETVARARHDALVEIYAALDPNAPASGDKAIYQRQSAGKALLTHIALLRKLLRLDAPGGAAPRPETLDAAAYRAMVAALDEEVGEDG